MPSRSVAEIAAVFVVCVLYVAGASMPVHAQGSAEELSSVHGQVQDSAGNPVEDAGVFLKRTTGAATSSLSRTTRTDSRGTFHFANVVAGTYTLRAEKGGARGATGPVEVTRGQSASIGIVLSPANSSPGSSSPKGGSSAGLQAPEFFDEPQFTVAGVTQGTSAGGHGSDTVLRNSEALVKATVALGKEPVKESSVIGSTVANSDEGAKQRQEWEEMQAKLHREEASGDKSPGGVAPNLRARQAQSDLHHELAQIDEKLGEPLEAVREYQRAAELNPSEPNLFDWASELLEHRALEPAVEIFTRANHLYPQSERMLIGLGVACYARGSYDQAEKDLAGASDLAPEDPTPYLFMGKMQSVETAPTRETVERLARFQRLQPGNALANYYYAVGLWKSGQSLTATDGQVPAQVEGLLQTAVKLDPNLGAAYLQLGILYAQRGEYARAISAYKKAIEVSPELEETHYRLAQAYRRTGAEADAQKELQLHEQISKRVQEEAESQRREIQQFVVSLRDRGSVSQ